MFTFHKKNQRRNKSRIVLASAISGLISAGAMFLLSPKSGQDNRQKAGDTVKKVGKKFVLWEKQAEEAISEVAEKVTNKAQQAKEQVGDTVRTNINKIKDKDSGNVVTTKAVKVKKAAEKTTKAKK
jgi:gas vesicle protein